MSDNAEPLVESQSGEGDAVAAPAEGQAVSAPVEGQAPEVFHEYEWEPGKKDVWKSKEELNDWLRQSGMRHSDYTRKTQQVAEIRKRLEQQQKDYEGKERTFNESYSTIMNMDKFLKENPHVQARIAQEMKGTIGSNPDVERLLGEKLKPIQEKLSEYEKKEARDAEERARNQAYEMVGKKYTDFDRSVIDKAIQRLEEVPEQMRLEAMVELLYHAEKGRLTPGEIERRQAMNAGKPRATSPTSNVGIPDKQISAMSREEEMAAALAAMDAAGK